MQDPCLFLDFNEISNFTRLATYSRAMPLKNLKVLKMLKSVENEQI
jgi:hypothetical protein